VWNQRGREMADAVLVIARFSLVEASLLEGDRRWLGSTARYYVGWLLKEVGVGTSGRVHAVRR